MINELGRKNSGLSHTHIRWARTPQSLVVGWLEWDYPSLGALLLSSLGRSIITKSGSLQFPTGRKSGRPRFFLVTCPHVVNNPIRYTDHSGKKVDCNPYENICPSQNPLILQKFGVTMDGDWSEYEIEYSAVVNAVSMVNYRFSSIHPHLANSFLAVFDKLTFRIDSSLGAFFGKTSGHLISLNPDKVRVDKYHILGSSDPLSRLVVHEIAHAFAYRIAEKNGGAPGVTKYDGTNNPVAILNTTSITDSDGNFVTGTRNGCYDRNGRWYAHEAGSQNPYLGDSYQRWDENIGKYIVNGYQWHPRGMDSEGNGPQEDWADIFMNWTYKSFAGNKAGKALYNWVDINMQQWLKTAMGPWGGK